MNNCIANNVTAVRNLLKENLAGDVIKHQNQHGETALHVSLSSLLSFIFFDQTPRHVLLRAEQN